MNAKKADKTTTDWSETKNVKSFRRMWQLMQKELLKVNKNKANRNINKLNKGVVVNEWKTLRDFATSYSTTLHCAVKMQTKWYLCHKSICAGSDSTQKWFFFWSRARLCRSACRFAEKLFLRSFLHHCSRRFYHCSPKIARDLNTE